MENKLTEIIESINETNRTRWAQEHKEKGGNIIGILCSYIPEEIIYAAGILPWHVAGSNQSNISRALLYRTANSSLYCNRVLESLLIGELDFLDGVIATDREQELMRLWDVWVHLDKTPFTYIMHIPTMEGNLAIGQMSSQITRLIAAVEGFSGSKITVESLWHAIDVFNKTRSLLGRLYELRKREVPPVSGAEAMAIVAASTIMPKDEFNNRLELLLPYLEQRKVSLENVRPRLLLSSDTMYTTDYIELVEQAGCLVAMDDLDPGSRYFWKQVETKVSDPVCALAERYLSRPAHPCMFDWDKQVLQIVSWVKEFNIDGVLEMPEIYSIPRQFRSPFFQAELTKAGIPNMSVPRFYDMGDAGQLTTRIQAFIEMLSTEL